MANKNERTYGNVPGPFYVDISCVDCDVCRHTAPDIFKRDEDAGVTFVSMQPVTPAQIAAATEGMQGCPTESIGNDG